MVVDNMLMVLRLVVEIEIDFEVFDIVGVDLEIVEDRKEELR